MRKIEKIAGRKSLVFLCTIVLFAFVTFVASCSKDCKKCTNSVTNTTSEFCDDELEEAEKLPNMTCK